VSAAATDDWAPLRQAVERLRATDPECRLVLADGDSGAEWTTLDGPDVVGEAFEVAERRLGGSRAAIGASVAALLVDGVVTATWPLLLAQRRLPAVHASNVAVRLHPELAWFEHVTIRTPACHGDDLHERFVDGLVTTFAPWFDEVRARAPFGRAGMWGQVADELHGGALWHARQAGTDARAAWDEAGAVVDLLAEQVPALRSRPRPLPVRWPGGEATWQVKGTCCLWYQTRDGQALGDDGYCVACPLRTDEAARQDRLVEWLRPEAG